MAIRTIQCPSCNHSVSYNDAEGQCVCGTCGNRIIFDKRLEETYIPGVKEEREKLREKDKEAVKDRMERREIYRNVWEKTKKVWIFLLIASALISFFFRNEITMGIFAWVLIIGACVVFFSKPVSWEERLPWYYTALGIFLIGIPTCGAYWFVGPYLRIRWKRKNGRYDDKQHSSY